MGERFERAWRWAKQHPVTVTTALVLVTALVLPHFRSAAHPTADLDSDETPLFV
jgi:hypothetical protein